MGSNSFNLPPWYKYVNFNDKNEDLAWRKAELQYISEEIPQLLKRKEELEKELEGSA